MQPENKFIRIKNNLPRINQLFDELVLQPRINAIKWSKITKQTPNIKIGYPGQHLASLITGMEGERTGARGNDLIDGSEVKSCSRIDQLDKCLNCGGPVARLEEKCSNCNSGNIQRGNDSKWLFGIRNKEELDVLTKQVKRVVLILGDYPNFDNGDYNTLRFQAFEIWTNDKRCKRFVEIMTNYYYKIYLAHKKKDASKTPAPKNFWPYQYQFFVCNPILIFSCIVENANSNPKIKVLDYVKPSEDRSKLESIIMPADILSDEELNILFKKAQKEELLKMIKPEMKNKIAKARFLSVSEKRDLFRGIDETLRSYLPLRDTDKISIAKNKYIRRIH